MRPQHVPAGPAVPGRDVTTANRWPCTRALPIEDEEIVGAGFHAELRRPAIADGTSELEGPFGECDREVRQMRESSSGSWSPAGVATREGLPHARCQPFGADPRRIADHEVEPAAVDHLSEVGLEREKRSRALLAQPAPREPQFAQALAQP